MEINNINTLGIIAGGGRLFTKANWKQNAGRLRSEMNLKKPIYDSYINYDGTLIKTRGFLNAERSLLIDRGWNYSVEKRAWLPTN
jgi:hypothetical protein